MLGMTALRAGSSQLGWGLAATAVATAVASMTALRAGSSQLGLGPAVAVVATAVASMTTHVCVRGLIARTRMCACIARTNDSVSENGQNTVKNNYSGPEFSSDFLCV